MRNLTTAGVFLLISLGSCKKESTGGGTPETTPNLNISDVFKPEGNGGNSNMDFVLKLSAPATKEVSVRVTTKEGFAKAGEDFIAVDQKVIFSAGESQKTVSISIVGDDLKEGVDDFQLALSEGVNCTIISNYATGTIDNDDTKIPVTDIGYTTPTSYTGKTLV